MKLVAFSMLLVSATVFIDAVEMDPKSPNLCEVQEMVQVETMVPTREPTQVKYKTWCLSIPPQCYSYKTVYQVVYRKNVESVPTMVKKCCEGYLLHSNGTCVQCPAGKWGQQCQKDCTCRNNAICDNINGRCDCRDGWQGLTCEQACLKDHYGRMCLQVCRCENGAQCDSMTGACKCPNGFCGPMCEKGCSPAIVLAW